MGIYGRSKFLVDQETGLTSEPVSNAHYDIRELMLPRDSQNSLKVFSKSNKAWSTHFLTVATWQESSLKPFVLLTDGLVYEGMCLFKQLAR